MKNNKIKKRAHKLYILSLIYYFLFLIGGQIEGKNGG
jgi:hypothetical protein